MRKATTWTLLRRGADDGTRGASQRMRRAGELRARVRGDPGRRAAAGRVRVRRAGEAGGVLERPEAGRADLPDRRRGRRGGRAGRRERPDGAAGLLREDGTGRGDGRRAEDPAEDRMGLRRGRRAEEDGKGQEDRMTGTWISAALELPKAGRRVLAVKEGSG